MGVNLRDLPPKYREQAIKQMSDTPKKRINYPFTFDFHHELKSINVYSGKPKEIALRAKEKAGFIKELWAAGFLNIDFPNCLQYVSVTRYYGGKQRQWDDGNMEGGNAKQLIDAMTFCGFWKDDSPGYIKVKFLQERNDKKRGFCRVTIGLDDFWGIVKKRVLVERDGHIFIEEV